MSERQLAIELLPDHQSWCHADGHAECCAGECDCGIDESRDAVARAIAEAEARGRAEGRAEALKELRSDRG